MAPDILRSVFEFLFLVPSFFTTRRTGQTRAPGLPDGQLAPFQLCDRRHACQIQPEE